jgi:hypothetical protein
MVIKSVNENQNTGEEPCCQLMSLDAYKLEVIKELQRQAEWPLRLCIVFAEAFEPVYYETIKANGIPCPESDVAQELFIIAN